MSNRGVETEKRKQVVCVCWSLDVLHEVIDRRKSTQERLSSGGALATRALIHCGRTWEEQVLGKYEVEESNKKADKGRGEQRRWHVHAEENKYKPSEL